MNQDFVSILNTGWFDKEIIGMKVVEDLTKEDVDYLNTLAITTPENAGNLQKLLNRQYYLLNLPIVKICIIQSICILNLIKAF